MAERMKKSLFFGAVLCSGLAAALVLCAVSGRSFGRQMLPFAVCVDGFVFAAVGFFQTEGKSGALYGVCTALCLFCAIVQAAMVL
mgnify:CR=1 FL=1